MSFDDLLTLAARLQGELERAATSTTLPDEIDGPAVDQLVRALMTGAASPGPLHFAAMGRASGHVGHIGIVGCSAEGAALCYRTICQEGAQFLGPHGHPEVSMHTPSLATTMSCIYRGDWKAVANIMLDSAKKLAAVGAEFLICPDNTIHQALPLLRDRSPLPWLHIAEVVADEAVERRFRCLGLTGTRWLVESEVYPEKLAARGLSYLRPSPAEREEINRIIMDELVCGVFRTEATSFFQGAIARLKEAGCDAVVLGCTEIPLIIDDARSPLPTLDSTRLLARAALRRACPASPPL